MHLHFKSGGNCIRGCAAFLLTFAATEASWAAPAETVLFNFGVVRSGNMPQTALTPGPGGVYYGTTVGGGVTGNGTVFELAPSSGAPSGWKETVLYSFHGTADGASPSGAMLVGKDGTLYGVTASGGPQNSGVAFRLVPPANGQGSWTETTLHSFDGANDGAAPFGALVADANGVLYGSTAGGGSGSGGVVFSLTPPSMGQSAWTETALYSFQFGSDGISPSAGVFLDTATGAIFGMTSAGGLNNDGEIYRLTPPANGGKAWTKTDLYDFRGGADGNYPVGALVRDQSGIFYGVTDAGGTPGWGTVFSLAPPSGKGAKWVESVLYQFTGQRDGGAPNSSPVLAPDGTVYGATNAGGNVGSGTVFALTPPQSGKGSWTEASLASFDGPNGVNPVGVTLDPSGALIGATMYGGTLGNGGGTVFALTPPAPGKTAWTQTELRQFRIPGKDAASPTGALLMDKSGALYGSANFGGIHGQGAVYQLTPPGDGETAWHETVLHSFDGKDGGFATGKLLQGKGGVLYGVTSDGGASGNGVVYALVPPGAGQSGWSEQVLHVFKGVAIGDGAYPAAGLIADASGALYGTTGSGGVASNDNTQGNGIVFKLTPPANGQGAWKETVLYRFAGPDGSTPQGSLLFDSSGALYGTTYVGGSMGEGAVFKLTPPAKPNGQWTETVLHSFNVAVGNDGAIPGAEQLVMDAAGALYGTASQGGANNVGAVFKLAPPTGNKTTWTETVIHNFSVTDGNSPFTGLLANRKGVLFGVTEQGGAYNHGTVFKLAPRNGGASWAVTVLHDFDPTYGQDGANATGELIRGANGELLGTAAAGGHGLSGVVFAVTP